MAAGKVLSAYAKVTAGPKVKTEEEKAAAKEVKAAKAAEVARLAGLGPEERAAEVEHGRRECRFWPEINSAKTRTGVGHFSSTNAPLPSLF